jgi:AraC family transcriptional regulator, regulatory protein of adaptative response / DNA-3-methyladenine glycosylase II
MAETRQPHCIARVKMAAVLDDFDRCYRAVTSRDPRFDGWFVTAVTSTGVYCRPSCPAVTPKRENVRFYPTAAAAQVAGFRACLRCRPDAAPGSPDWLARTDVAARAVRLILDGTVDREGVSGLARRLGYSARQLHRVLLAEVGSGALALARAQRAQTARILLHTTELPIANVAFAAGFASVRQFNDTIRTVFGRTPTELRRRRRGPAGGDGQRIALRLAHRRPLATAELLAFLGARAIPGVEAYDGARYRRSLRLPHGEGWVELTAGDDTAVHAVFALDDLRDLTAAIARCRRLLALDADPIASDEALASDPMLRPLVRRTPGLRVPGATDGFELAARAVIGQQVSVAGARTVAGALVRAAGCALASPGPVTHLFPSADTLAELAERRPEVFPMPAARRRALAAIATAVASGEIALDRSEDPAELRARMLALPGIGPWTAEYVAMRAIGDPDAFLSTDLGVRRALARLGAGGEPDAVAERWRPWRAHAVAHLWAVPEGAAA